MKVPNSALRAAGALLLSSVATAQVLTEVRISTSSFDEEYVEIFGTEGQSTDGLMILNVEGDPMGAGFLERAYDLSGNSFGVSDPFFVFGSSQAEAAFPNAIDLAPGDDLFENSSITVYLISVPDAALRADILSTGTGWSLDDISSPAGSTTTRLTTDPGVTILDAVAFSDGSAGAMFFDGAPVFGPDGPFLPSGVLRDGGCPGDWCGDTFINFWTDGVPNPPYAEPTPGSVNPVVSCSTVPSVASCNDGLGAAYCTANFNSTGAAGQLAAAGSLAVPDNDLTLIASDLPLFTFGFFIASLDQGFVMNAGGSSGNLCVAGSIGRLIGPGQIRNSGTDGGYSLTIDLSSIPQPTGPVAGVPGATWNFQSWYRDSNSTGATSSFTRGLEVTLR